MTLSYFLKGSYQLVTMALKIDYLPFCRFILPCHLSSLESKTRAYSRIYRRCFSYQVGGILLLFYSHKNGTSFKVLLCTRAAAKKIPTFWAVGALCLAVITVYQAHYGTTLFHRPFLSSNMGKSFGWPSIIIPIPRIGRLGKSLL